MNLSIRCLISFFTIFILFFILRCNNGKSGNETDSNSLSIDTFSTFPPEIGNCACFFSNDSIEFKNEYYIYMNDYGQVSFLKINGGLVMFTQTEYKKIDSLNTVEKFSSDDYEITIHTTHGGQNVDENWLYRGSIELRDKKGKTITKNFYGECDC